MERWLPRAGEREPGGETMIAICFRSFATTGSDPAQLANRLPPLKKEQRNPVTTLTSCWHRSAHRKNSAKRSPTRLLLGWEDSTGIWLRDGRAVTTHHLFWPNQPRRSASLLRFWLPNAGSTAREIVTSPVPGPNTHVWASSAALEPEEGGGGRMRVSDDTPRRVKSHGIS